MERIIGKQLSSVEFVQDYVQLRFDGVCLTAYVWPTVVCSSTTLALSHAGYRDALCGNIGRIVKAAHVEEGKRIQIEFEGGTMMMISLRPQDYQGPEAAELQDGDNRVVF